MASRGSKASTGSPSLFERATDKKEMNTVNLAKRRKEGGQAPWPEPIDPKRLLKCQGWDQTPTDVTITILAGKKLSGSDIEVEFSDTDVSVMLTDGRRWYCRFHDDIDREASRVQLQKMKIILKLRKKMTEQPWANLELQQPVADKAKMSPVKIAASKQDAKKKQNEASRSPADDAKTFRVDKDTEQEPPYDLNHVQHDFYELASNPHELALHIYVKQTDKDSVKVTFLDKEIITEFQTKDPKFLTAHENAKDDTTFRWKIKIADYIIPEKSKFKLTNSVIEIILYKKTERKWGALEASQAKTALRPSTANWQNTSGKAGSSSSSTVNIAAVKPHGDAPVKAAFDEMEEAEAASTSSDTSSSSCAKAEDKTASKPSSSSSRAVTRSPERNKEKPTAMVSPLNKSQTTTVSTGPCLGMTGLDNLGNTCFMNSVLQIMANTRELRDYFLQGAFQKEVNADNPLGHNGKLAVNFAVLMKVLWTGRYRSYAPAKLKNLVAMKVSQFMGYAQHDAQEFMNFLLDGLHEDINRVIEKPYTEAVDSNGRPDEVVADEAWQRHKLRNNSFIVDLFQGQYKSTLVCPVCQKVSITFDPFMHLPVPLPKKQRLLPIIFMSCTPNIKPIKYMLRLPKDANVDHLKDAVSQKTGVHPRNLRIFEAYKNKILTLFESGTSLTSVTSTDTIMCCEVLSQSVAGEAVLEIAVLQRTMLPQSLPSKCSYCQRSSKPGVKLKRCTRCYRTAYCNQHCQKQDWERHRSACRFLNELVGQPFILSLPKSQATYARLCQMVQTITRYSVDTFQPPVPIVKTDLDRTELQTPDCLSTESATISKKPQTVTSSSANQNSPSHESESPHSVDAGELEMRNEKSPAVASDQSTSSSSSTDGTFITVQSSSDGANLNLALESSNEADLQQTDLSDASVANDSYDEVDKELSDNTGGNAVLPDCAGLDKSSSNAPPTRAVMGRIVDGGNMVAPPFEFHACDRDGRNLHGASGHPLQDRGEDPLNLGCVSFLAIDWKNCEKQQPYVLVQSKELECDEDESLTSTLMEENKELDLSQCLSLFTEPEILSPEEAWYCPECKEHREATKQMSIWRLPPTLIIQLKRFSFRNFICRDKIDKHIHLPIRGLNLSSYYIGSRPSCEPPPIYDLYGVINHYGGLLGGHYTAAARCPDYTDLHKNEFGWRNFDDSYVTTMDENQVVTHSAYILFYRRRNMTVSLPAVVSDTESESCDSASNDADSNVDENALNDDHDNRMASGDGADVCGDNRHGYSAPTSSAVHEITETDRTNATRHHGQSTHSPSSLLTLTDMDTVD